MFVQLNGRGDPNRTTDIASWAHPTAGGLIDDVDPLPARGMNPAFILWYFYRKDKSKLCFGDLVAIINYF
jgi:hypothetical protein